MTRASRAQPVEAFGTSILTNGGGIELRLVLDDDQLDAIARRVAAILAEPVRDGDAGGWLDTKGAAAYLAASTGRIHDLVQLGALTPARDGRRLLFRRSDLDAYLEESR
jgi:excisionase family DNA binding protein